MVILVEFVFKINYLIKHMPGIRDLLEGEDFKKRYELIVRSINKRGNPREAEFEVFKPSEGFAFSSIVLGTDDFFMRPESIPLVEKMALVDYADIKANIEQNLAKMKGGKPEEIILSGNDISDVIECPYPCVMQLHSHKEFGPDSTMGVDIVHLDTIYRDNKKKGHEIRPIGGIAWGGRRANRETWFLRIFQLKPEFEPAGSGIFENEIAMSVFEDDTEKYNFADALRDNLLSAYAFDTLHYDPKKRMFTNPDVLLQFDY